jgi:hypothetical protein
MERRNLPGLCLRNWGASAGGVKTLLHLFVTIPLRVALILTKSDAGIKPYLLETNFS